MPEVDAVHTELRIAAGSLLATLLGFLFIIFQVRRLGKSVRTAAHAAIYSQAAGFRNHLMTCPQLRPYFFDGADIDSQHPDYARALTLAELFLNHVEHLAIQKTRFAGNSRKAWLSFGAQALEASPISKRRLLADQAACSPDLPALVR